MNFIVLNKNESSFFNFYKTRLNLINEYYYYYLNVYGYIFPFYNGKSDKLL